MDISVAICTYNGEEYLEDQLDSILQQERPPDELVICDDGSKDGTPDILKEYQSRHPDLVEVYFNEETKGIVRNFSECIERCSGDVVALSDQDDVWHSNKLQRKMAAFKRHVAYLVGHDPGQSGGPSNRSSTSGHRSPCVRTALVPRRQRCD